jgi:hypothetical protein
MQLYFYLRHLKIFFSLLCGTLYYINIKGGFIMSKRQLKIYAPHQRNFLEQDPKEIRSYSKRDSTKLADPVSDPIVAMNISNVEFDYTYNGGEDILDNED